MEVHAIKTWYDQRYGVVEIQDDVLDVVKRVKAIDSRLSVFYNEQTGGFDLVENCLDGTDRLVFSVDELDQRVLDRLALADHWHGNDVPTHVRGEADDFATQMDAENDALEAALTREKLDRINEAGERLAWALNLPLRGNAGKGESIFVKEMPDGKDD